MSDSLGASWPVGLLLLAAGRAQRFGSDKLGEPIAQCPLVQHTALAFAGLPFACRIAVVGQSDHGLSNLGFECHRVSRDKAALSASIAIGVDAIMHDPALDGVLIALGDMPLVTPNHIERLLAAFDGSTVATAVGGRPQPPAIFGRSHFAALLALEGDRGARELLADALQVEADPAMLVDVDTPTDLETVRAKLAQT